MTPTPQHSACLVHLVRAGELAVSIYRFWCKPMMKNVAQIFGSVHKIFTLFSICLNIGFNTDKGLNCFVQNKKYWIHFLTGNLKFEESHCVTFDLCWNIHSFHLHLVIMLFGEQSYTRHKLIGRITAWNIFVIFFWNIILTITAVWCQTISTWI